jgi:hypothetical protein
VKKEILRGWILRETRLRHVREKGATASEKWEKNFGPFELFFVRPALRGAFGARRCLQKICKINISV